MAAKRLLEAVEACGGRACGWDALETARIEAGIPRYGADMDESNLPLEAGIEDRAVSYTKGCYIGQEIVARLRTYGHVTKSLCGLRFENDLKCSPQKTDKLYRGDNEIGYVTSFVFSPTLNTNIALGYVRREHLQSADELTLRTADGDCTARIVALPFLPKLRPSE
jgi:folate-binding protein YgfZ